MFLVTDETIGDLNKTCHPIIKFVSKLLKYISKTHIIQHKMDMYTSFKDCRDQFPTERGHGSHWESGAAA